MCTGFYVCTCTCMCVHMYGCIYIDSYMYVCMYNHMLTSIVHVLYVYLHMGHTGDTAWPGLWLAPILQLSFLRRGLGLYRAVGSGEKEFGRVAAQATWASPSFALCSAISPICMQYMDAWAREVRKCMVLTQNTTCMCTHMYVCMYVCKLYIYIVCVYVKCFVV